MEGDNEPVRRLVTGARNWDYSLHGLAHTGLLPDLLQDLRNLGVNAQQMDALFRSVEDYIEMWEKAEVAKEHVEP